MSRLPRHFFEDVETNGERKRESYDYSPRVERESKTSVLHSVVRVVGHCFSSLYFLAI